MFHTRQLRSTVAAMILVGLSPAWLMAQSEEDKLVAVVRSGASKEEKMLACKRLADIGGGESVSAMAPLVADEELSHAARIALEAIPGPAAARALREAAARMKGKLLVGVINSIGARRDPEAVAVLGVRLADADPEVAAAAAAALGKIATVEAARALQSAADRASAGVRSAVADGSLACAEAFQARGKREHAAAIYDRLRQADLPEHVRLAATQGAILTAASARSELLVELLQAKDFAAFSAALGVSRELTGPEVTQALVGQLASLLPDRRALVIAVLADRGDASARPAVMEAAAGEDLHVRVAALRALATLGDAAALPLLVEAVKQPEPTVASAAVESLAALPGKEVDAAVAGALDGAQGELRLSLLDLAGRRRIAAAMGVVTRAADDPDQRVRLAAIGALGRIIMPRDLSLLTRRLLATATPQERSAVEEALRAACLRSADKETCAKELAASLPKAPADVRLFLLELLGSIGGRTAMEAVSAAAADPSPEVQDTATRILGQWITPDAAPVLLEVARKSPSAKLRVRTLRGFIRIIRQMDVPDDRKLAMCRDALALAERDDEKALVLEALGRIPSRESLSLVVSHLGSASLAHAAGAAAVSIAESIASTERAAVAEAMPRVIEASKDAELTRRAKELLARTGAP